MFVVAVSVYLCIFDYLWVFSLLSKFCEYFKIDKVNQSVMCHILNVNSYGSIKNSTDSDR